MSRATSSSSKPRHREQRPREEQDRQPRGLKQDRPSSRIEKGRREKEKDGDDDDDDDDEERRMRREERRRRHTGGVGGGGGSGRPPRNVFTDIRRRSREGTELLLKTFSGRKIIVDIRKNEESRGGQSFSPKQQQKQQRQQAVQQVKDYGGEEMERLATLQQRHRRNSTEQRHGTHTSPSSGGKDTEGAGMKEEEERKDRTMQQQQQQQQRRKQHNDDDHDDDANVNESVSGNVDNDINHPTGEGGRTNAHPTTNTEEDDANHNARGSSVPSDGIPARRPSVLNKEQQLGIREALARIQQFSLDRPQQPSSFAPSLAMAFTTGGGREEDAKGAPPLASRSNLPRRQSIDSSIRLVRSLRDSDGCDGQRRRSIHSSIRIGEGGVNPYATAIPQAAPLRRSFTELDISSMGKILPAPKATHDEVSDRPPRRSSSLDDLHALERSSLFVYSHQEEEEILRKWRPKKSVDSKNHIQEDKVSVDERGSGPRAGKEYIVECIHGSDSNGMTMLDKMDVKKNGDGDAVRNVTGRFNGRNSGDGGKANDTTTRDKGMGNTTGVVPGGASNSSDKRRRQSAAMYNRRQSQSEDDSSDQNIGRRSSDQPKKHQQESSSQVPKGQRKRRSRKDNFHIHHTQSQSDDEESSEKKKNSEWENRVLSQSVDGENSKRGSESSKRMSTSAESDKTGESTRRGSQAASEKSNIRSSDKSRRHRANDGSAQIIGDRNDRSRGGKISFFSRRFRVSPLAMCTMCLCYLLTMCLCVGLGFFLHMRFFPDLTPSSADQIDEPNLLGTISPSHRPSTTSEIATISAKLSPSTMVPDSTFSSLLPSGRSSTSLPSSTPSIDPTSMPTSSYVPTLHPSNWPSSSPTGIPGCPDTLLNWVTLDDDNLLTLNYDVIVYHGAMGAALGGGLLCLSLEYSGSAGWIGLAFSEASRDPQFGLKEAIIGIPGLPNSVAVAEGGSAGLGQQSNVALVDGPTFINPAKYLLPAGGTGKDGYSGPSLNLLVGAEKQTLVNGSVSVVEGQQLGGGIISDQDQISMQQKTRLSFTKYLRELNEIEIDPYGSTLFLYAVASLDSEGEYNGNPEWQSTTLTFLANSSDARGNVRKRSRREIPYH